MSFKAVLIINDERRVILNASQFFSRYFDTNGKPTTKPIGGKLMFSIESTVEDSFFYENMFSPTDKCKGEIIFYKRDGLSVLFKIEFANAQILNLSEHFDAKNNLPLHMNIEIGWGIARIRGVVFEESWNPNNPFIEIEPTIREEEEEEEEENDEFGISIKHIADKKTFVPLGVPAFSGTPENKNIEFEIEITENDIDDFQVEFLHNNKVIQTYYSRKQTLDEVVVTAKGSGNSSNSNTTDNENEQSNYPKGKYKLEWDGFDSNGIYHNTNFISGKFKARVKGSKNGNEKTAESTEFSFKYKEVNWVDAKIDKNNKRIDITLRVNLKDGGAKGLRNWNKIPKKDLTSKEPIKTRTKSFEDLEKLAIDGLNYHWGRNKNHYIAKNVDINGEVYEIFINTINTTENVMDDVSLIFNTNRKWMRSGNPGTVEDPISAVGNLISREAVCYNVGYLKYSNGWGYQNSNDENIEFKFTSAHEIGHTILKAYGGTFYSYGHKGSVNTITQKMKSDASNYPADEEIDIMPYYPISPPPHLYNRYIASEKDVLSLIWLTKITKE
ncbi:type VI secretion system tube protein TssD [Lacinutrix mariniflava]|uniref:type VI secretion system tube protein TssD n=1 Tax=Lacinutrix mariniflava TaxID=342955 RepID=UPI0006E44CB6|nr:type VI secretion system tube protein TssD [Lacinutrix mariniflava]